MQADIGPFTHCHLDLALLSFAYVLTHAVRILFCTAPLDLFHSPVQDVIWSAGMRTLGSADCDEKRPFLNTHRSTDVAHVPAAMRPVALAVLVLALSMLVGAMPIAVKP